MRVSTEMGLRPCLWGIILITLIEVRGLAHHEWHHTLSGILDYIDGERKSITCIVFIAPHVLIVDVMWAATSSPWSLDFPTMMIPNKPFVTSEYYINNRKISNRNIRHTQRLEVGRGRKGLQCYSEQELCFWMGTAPSVMSLKGKAKTFLSCLLPSIMVSHIHASCWLSIPGKQKSRERSWQLICVLSH